MPRRTPTGRAEARLAILEAATQHRLRLHYDAAPYRARHLQRAVKVCRANRLVSGALLHLAGYRPSPPGPDKATLERFRAARARRLAKD